MAQTISQKLSNLLNLNHVDKSLADIAKVRGDLPEEVQYLEDSLAEIQAQLQKDEESLVDLEDNIKMQRIKIKDSEKMIKRYEEHQMNIRNSREYDAVTKELELHKLDIQLAEKNIKAYYEQIEKKKVEIEDRKLLLTKSEKNLEEKQQELKSVIEGTVDTEKDLHQKRERIIHSFDASLLQLYETVRRNVRQSLAVSIIRKSACSGCFTVVYPQMEAEVREKNVIVTCPHCGRIIADVADPFLEEDNDVTA